MTHLRSVLNALAWPVMVVLAGSPVYAQQNTTAPSAAEGNKAAKPPVEAAASESGVATKKPAKPGAQSGPAAPEVESDKAAKGNKAGKPPVDQTATRSGVATEKPAKSGTQSGPAASGPQQ